MPKVADLVIRGGTIIDGTGKPPFIGDIAISSGRILAIGDVAETGREEIDATGMIVTPGFIDVHTHYDAQITWEHTLAPSSAHGTTTVIFGNCGIGFAPCRPEHRHKLIKLMEGIEDIPEVVMDAGLPWNWESYPEFLDSLADRECDIDFGSMIPHAPVRVYAMGQRGLDREPATAADIAEMARIVKEGLEAGALGFSTSRSLLHRTNEGTLAPTTTAAEEELTGIALAMNDSGKGIFQLIDDFHDATPERCTEFELMRRISASSGRPVHFSLVQLTNAPGRWAVLTGHLENANRDGFDITAQIYPRPMGGLLGFDLAWNPFSLNPSYQEVADLPFEERIEALRQPDLRKRLIEEEPIEEGRDPKLIKALRRVEPMFPLDDPPQYMKKPEDTVGARAAARGVSPFEVAYDDLLENGGRAKLFTPVGNTLDPTYDDVLKLIRHEDTIVALGDGGAHYGLLCDASYTTHMLTYWTRDREQGEKIPVVEAIKRLSYEPARAYGLDDRGVLAPGYKADLNVIDYDNLKLLLPTGAADLPAGGMRVRQQAQGYKATIVSGVVTYRDGVATGALPGRLLRGGQGSSAKAGSDKRSLEEAAS